MPEVSVSFPCRARSTLLPRHAMSDDSFGRIHVGFPPAAAPRRGARGEARRSGHHAQGQRGRVPKRTCVAVRGGDHRRGHRGVARRRGKIPKVIVVHGAGSFGHQHAKAYGVARGGAGALQERAPENDVTRRLRLGIQDPRRGAPSQLAGGFRARRRGRARSGRASPYGAWSTRGGGEDPRLETSPRARAAATQTLSTRVSCRCSTATCASARHGLRRLVRRRRRARALRLVPPEARGVRDGRPGDIRQAPPKPSARARGKASEARQSAGGRTRR